MCPLYLGRATWKCIYESIGITQSMLLWVRVLRTMCSEGCVSTYYYNGPKSYCTLTAPIGNQLLLYVRCCYNGLSSFSSADPRNSRGKVDPPVFTTFSTPGGPPKGLVRPSAYVRVSSDWKQYSGNTVSHSSTNRTQCCLASVIIRELVCPSVDKPMFPDLSFNCL